MFEVISSLWLDSVRVTRQTDITSFLARFPNGKQNVSACMSGRNSLTTYEHAHRLLNSPGRLWLYPVLNRMFDGRCAKQRWGHHYCSSCRALKFCVNVKNMQFFIKVLEMGENIVYGFSNVWLWYVWYVDMWNLEWWGIWNMCTDFEWNIFCAKK
jgi:hypothetical protein